MTPDAATQVRRVFDLLAKLPEAIFGENEKACRVDNVAGLGKASYEMLRNAILQVEGSPLASLKVYGDISGEIDVKTTPLEALQQEKLHIRLEKIQQDDIAVFITLDGLSSALEDLAFTAKQRRIWLPFNFQRFTTASLAFSAWGQRQELPNALLFDSPRKLVRDQTHRLTPDSLSAWYLVEGGLDQSAVFKVWRRAALLRLSLSIPSEIRPSAGADQVVMRGARTSVAALQQIEEGDEEAVFSHLSEAIRWVYDQPRDTETKFYLLNNHLSLDWREGATWPAGLRSSLAGSLTSAREAFGFHLQDQSKDALKSLGDLRKALQDDVARSQQSTKDLLSAMWRDVAIAGAVFAFKTTGTQSATLQWVAIAATILLTSSILIMLLANSRFDTLSKNSRKAWKNKLYAFMDERHWVELVDKPIKQARTVYRIAVLPTLIVYLVLIVAMLAIAYPNFGDWLISYSNSLLSYL